MKIKQQINSYFQYHHYSILILFCSLAVLWSGFLFSFGYGIISTDNIDDYQEKYQPNIYLTTFYEPEVFGDNRNEKSHIFQRDEMEYVDYIDNINPIYFSLMHDIEIETNQYANQTYKIKTDDNLLLDVSEKVHSKDANDRIIEMTYNQANKPSPSQIIHSYSNEGVYINESFLKNYNIDTKNINNDTTITFTVHVPLYYLQYQAGAPIQRIVHSVTMSKKIKAIVKDNNDLMNISEAKNLILYPLNDCLQLMDEYKNLDLSNDMKTAYYQENAYASAYCVTSSDKKIIDDYNDISIYQDNENDGLTIVSSYYEYQKQKEDIQFIQETTKLITKIIGIVIIIYFTISLKKIKMQNHEKKELMKKLSYQDQKIYLRQSMFTEIKIFMLTWLVIELLLMIAFELLKPEINTSYLAMFILSLIATFFICILCLMRYFKLLKT